MLGIMIKYSGKGDKYDVQTSIPISKPKPKPNPIG